VQYQRIGIYVTSLRELAYVEYIRSIANVVAFTSSKLVSEGFNKQKSSCIFLNSWKGDLKKFIKDSNFNYVVLFNDSFSPEACWIQKKIRTILIPTHPVFCTNSQYFNKAAEASETGVIKNFIVNIFGLYQNCNSGRYDFFGSYGEVFYFLLKKLIYCYKPQELILGGRFAYKIFAPNTQYKKAYMSIGINQSKIEVSGSISCAVDEYQAQSYLDQIHNIEEGKLFDVLLISQPFYKYKKYKKLWHKEVESFINDCKESDLSYRILLHPRDDKNCYSSIVSENCIIASDGFKTILDIYSLAKSSRLIVSKSSTLMNSFIRLKMPIAYINYFNMAPIVNIKQCILNEMVLDKGNKLSKILNFTGENSSKIINHQILQSKKNGCVDYSYRFKQLFDKLETKE
jgi:hypothetical protein